MMTHRYPFLCSHPDSNDVGVYIPDVAGLPDLLHRWTGDDPPPVRTDDEGIALLNVTPPGAGCSAIVELTLRAYLKLLHLPLAA